MGLVEGINTAWIPYYYRTMDRYTKKKHLDRDKSIQKKLKTIYSLACIMPVFTTYKELDIVNKKIDVL